jgi:DNA end-binding protein Ku
MAASVWSGYLTFGLISMPVRLFSAARSSHVQFNMLHRDDHVRIKQQLYCPQDERVVSRDEIVKGYEYEKGEYVIIEPADIKKIEPKTTKAMEILEFVKSSEIDPVYFESSYYLVPEEAGQRPYALLTRALEESEYVAIAKVAMHNREYTIFLRPTNGGLMLHTMFYENEVRQVEQFGKTSGIELKDAEVKVAHQLVEALAADFDPKKYSDTFEENVKKLIQARLEGKEVAAVEKPRKPAPVVDLMAALKESLAQIPKKPAQRVAEAQRPVAITAGGKSGRKKQGIA